MRLQTPVLRLVRGVWESVYGGKDWMCADRLSELIGPIDPAATIRLVATSRKTKGSVRFVWNPYRGGDLYGPDNDWVSLYWIAYQVIDKALGEKRRVLWVRVEVIRPKTRGRRNTERAQHDGGN